MGAELKDKELKEAKLNLYRLLLLKGQGDLSEQEIEELFNLGRDSDIVAIRKEVFATKRAEEAAVLKAVNPEEKPAEGSPIQ